jgi:hypothetical protein
MCTVGLVAQKSPGPAVDMTTYPVARATSGKTPGLIEPQYAANLIRVRNLDYRAMEDFVRGCEHLNVVPPNSNDSF